MSTAPLTPVAQPVNTTNVPSALSAYVQHFNMVYLFDLNRINRVAEIVD
jgi:hypothetical protein